MMVKKSWQMKGFEPSIHSSLVIQKMQNLRDRISGAHVLDVGCGGGALLAAAGMLGAHSLSGVDIEHEAIAATRAELSHFADRGMPVTICHGHLYKPWQEQEFDVILANLPQFPMQDTPIGARRISWSAAGRDGRKIITPFLTGLGQHLSHNGRAIMAHNAFVDLDLTYQMLQAQGLTATVQSRLLTPLPQAKVDALSAEIFEKEKGQSLHEIGSHLFGDVIILLIEWAGKRT